MSLFSENIINDSPITAQFLRDIINRRRVNSDTPDEERYERILDRIYKVVEYNINKDVYYYEINIEAIDSICPFCDNIVNEINNKIHEGTNESDLFKFVKERKKELSREEFWGGKLLKFADYFKARGFNIDCDWKKYIKQSSQRERLDAKIIKISWDEEI